MPNDSASESPSETQLQQRWLTEHLLDAVYTERRLLHDLGRLMRQQRAAIAADDYEALDDATFGIQRVLHTLGEANRRPRIINLRLGGSENVPLTDMVESLGMAATPELLAARDDLREAARLLEDEVRTNRALLSDALAIEP
ncbi:MAG TPA: flagellar export chaperone FlgN [Gemmatimonadaceae bacterium]|jgi:hypothetical protein|nr:flagellar export chaperone FlgN [Gemmatimonadaceae bacterium]